MSTPSQGPLSFNARSSLPLSSAPVNHSVAWQNGLCYSYCVLAYPSVAGYSNSGRSVIVELKGWRCVARHDITPLTTHGGFGDVSMKRSACTITSVHIMSFYNRSVSAHCPSLTWVALSIPITTHISMVSKQPQPPPIHHPFQPRCSRARRLRSPPLSEVFTAALLAAFESSQPVLEAQRGKSNCSRRARITGETLRKKREKKILMWIQETRCLKTGHRVERVFLNARQRLRGSLTYLLFSAVKCF